MSSLISHEHQCVFVHVPRTGGTSVSTALADLFEPADPEHPHRRASDFGDVQGYEVVSVVRNPWDMCVSWVAWHHQNGDFRKTLEVAAQKVERPCLDYGIDEQTTVLRFESLQEEFDRLCDRWEVERRVLPLMSRSWHEPYRNYFADGGLVQAVAERFALEIELFGYEFS